MATTKQILKKAVLPRFWFNTYSSFYAVLQHLTFPPQDYMAAFVSTYLCYLVLGLLKRNKVEESYEISFRFSRKMHVVLTRMCSRIYCTLLGYNDFRICCFFEKKLSQLT